MSFSIAAIFKNEAPYILEWIAWHRVLGVKRFYVADNGSTDGGSSLLAALHRRGYLVHVPFPTPTGKAPQLLAYQEILASHAAHEEWLAFIDADEFMLPAPPFRTLGEPLMGLLSDSEVGAVVFNWATYGSSRLLNHAPGLVTERFTWRAKPDFGPNLHYKTLLRLDAFDGHIHNPHHFALKSGWRAVHADGAGLAPNLRHGKGLSEGLVWSPVRVNHYIVKSREEFDTRKRLNGSAASIDRVKGDKYFEGHDRNEVEDAPPAWLLEAVKAEIACIEQALAGDYQPLQSASVLPRHRLAFNGVLGHVDSVVREDGGVLITGWALLDTGEAVSRILVCIGETEHLFEQFERRPRSDVQRHQPHATALSGFRLHLACESEVSLASLKVYGAPAEGRMRGPFPFPARHTVA